MKVLVVALAAIFTFSLHDGNKELHCLATNIYHEARGEPLEGQLAVALVTKNRAKNSICDAVYAKKQFSWTSKYIKTKRNNKAWENAYAIANLALQYKYAFEATHYHAKYVHPKWKLQKIATIGNHIFYKV